MRWLPSLGRRIETKGGIDRRHSAGPYYAAPGVAYEQPLRDLDVDRAVSEAWAADVWVYRTIHARATNASRIDVVIKDGREKGARVIEDHPLAMLLNRRANKYETGQVFRYRLHTLLDLSKKGAPVEVIERRSGEVDALHILNPKWIWPIPDPDTFVSGFEMRLPSGQKYTLPPYERGRGGVLWIKRPHPTDPYSSSSWLEPTGVSIDLDRYARRYNLNFMFNDGRPGGVLMVKGEDGVDPKDAEDLQRYLSGGPGVAGRVRVMESDGTGGLEYVDLSTTPRDAQYVEGRSITKGEILGGGGTPESLWNASGRTFDNADAEYEGFWRNEMVPELELVGSFWEELTQGGPLDDSEVVTYAYDTVAVLQRDARQDEARAQVEFDKGLITADEYRDRTGKDPLDVAGTRVLWLAAGKAPVGAPEDVAELTGAPLPGEEPPPPELPPGGTPAALPRGSDQEQPPTLGAEPEILEGEIVEEEKVLDEAAYAAKALGSLPKDLVEQRRRAHASLLDHWEAELARALAEVLERQEQVVMARLGGTKARKHTRHWDYGPGGPRHEIKALDPTYVVERMRWAEEIVRGIADVVKKAFLAAGRATLAYLGITGDPEYDDDSRRVVAATVRSIAEGFDARAGKLQQVIRDAEAEGKPIPEIAAEVRSAYLSAATWAGVSSRQVIGAMNAASLMSAIQAGAVRKRWLSTDDERTRPTHVEAEGQQQEVGHRFRVGEASLAYPGDPSGPPEEVVSCRCTMLFQVGRDFEAELDEDLAALEADEVAWKEWQHPRDWRGRWAEKHFDEGKHPRDREGQFTESGVRAARAALAVGDVVARLDGEPLATVDHVVDGVPFVHHRDDEWALTADQAAKIAAPIKEVQDQLPGLIPAQVHLYGDPDIQTALATAGGWPHMNITVAKIITDDGFMRQYAKDWGRGLSIAGDTDEPEDTRRTILIHEQGHNVHRAIEHGGDAAKAEIDGFVNEMITPRSVGFWGGEQVDKQMPRWQTDALRKADGSPQSAYAGENSREWFAEAFADGWLHGDDASESGMRAVAMARKWLGGER